MQDPKQALIQKAVQLLKSGGLIGLPTETVYGLAADANNDTAVQKIFAAKGRPSDHPLIVHIGTQQEIYDWAIDVSPVAEKLMAAFWPGPLTLILKKNPKASMLISGGQDSIGVRMPNHPLALALLQAFGSGLAAPSANRFGHISPTCPEDVEEELQHQVDLILPGGSAEIGIESTIVDTRSNPCTILRQGMLSQEMLERALGTKILLHSTDSKLRVSGNLASHYAPHTPVILLSTEALEQFSHERSDSVIFLTYSKLKLPKTIQCIQLPKAPKAYAKALYASLRKADHQNAALIVVEQVPTDGLWTAIMDRLQRAATKK